MAGLDCNVSDGVTLIKPW